MTRAILVAVILAGCAAPVSRPVAITAKDGQQALFVECRRSPLNCHQRAQEACPGGYLPLEDNRRSRVHGDLDGLYTSHRFELTFRCR